jgi:hypothetical protein
MKLPRGAPVVFDLLGLAWDIAKTVARIVRPKKRGLPHADAERQAEAARNAGKKATTTRRTT